MRNQLLRDTDWASMAHSLEVRVPLVDATLLSRLAGPLQACATDDRKQFLAGSPTVPLPDRVARRPKTGFTTPVGDMAAPERGDPGVARGPRARAGIVPLGQALVPRRRHVACRDGARVMPR